MVLWNRIPIAGRGETLKYWAKREGSRTKLPLLLHVHSQHQAFSLFWVVTCLSRAPAEASRRGKADRIGLAFGVPLDQKGGALCCDPTLCLEVSPPLS